MSYAGSDAAAADVVRAASIAQAIKASGAIVSVNPDDFIYILSKTSRPLVITAVGGMFRQNYQYLTSYRSFIFFTKSATPIPLPADAELIAANKIWVP
jgi:hypothetical protein